eukprot:scaffold1960_cov242-Pinguiococcus_pyrenoidosus.AAC.16
MLGIFSARLARSSYHRRRSEPRRLAHASALRSRPRCHGSCVAVNIGQPRRRHAAGHEPSRGCRELEAQRPAPLAGQAEQAQLRQEGGPARAHQATGQRRSRGRQARVQPLPARPVLGAGRRRQLHGRGGLEAVRAAHVPRDAQQAQLRQEGGLGQANPQACQWGARGRQAGLQEEEARQGEPQRVALPLPRPRRGHEPAGGLQHGHGAHGQQQQLGRKRRHEPDDERHARPADAAGTDADLAKSNAVSQRAGAGAAVGERRSDGGDGAVRHGTDRRAC